MAYDHPEDVKGELRKRFRSVAAFERARALPPLSVRDVLRGKSRAKIAATIAKELGVPVRVLDKFKSHNRDDSRTASTTHRLNGGAK